MPITCPHCKKQFKGTVINSRHKAICDGWETPPPPKPCLCGHESTSLTQMKRHRRGCSVWKNRDADKIAKARRKQTSLERYGVEDARRSKQANAKRDQTNLEHYGAENPFSKESTLFDIVQERAQANRTYHSGEKCAFAWESTKEKIRQTMLAKYGVENPQQSKEIRERTTKTCDERYGGVLHGSPSLSQKIRQTNLDRYDTKFPQQTDEVKEKIRQTNLERYGVTSTTYLLHDKLRYTTEQFIEIADGVHNGVYDYSKVAYFNTRTKVTIGCYTCGGWFDQTPNSHARGQGCPKCSTGKSERLFGECLRESFPNETILDAQHYTWLTNPDTGYPLELDYYIPALGLAFEVQGIQHYEPVDYFGGEENFKKVQNRDTLKRTLCESQGIALHEYDLRRGKKREDIEAFLGDIL